jgi:hypothetical protein
MFVSTIAVDTGVDDNVQAKDVRTHTIRKNNFRLISRLSIQDTILE